MADNGALRGVQGSGDRYGAQRQHHQGERPAAAPPRPAAAADRIELSDGAAMAWSLLRERVLAATRCLFGTAPPAALPFQGGVLPATADEAVQQIEREQLRSVGGAATRPTAGADLTAAFRDGLEDARGILLDIGHLEAATAAWFDAIEALLAGRKKARPPATA